MEVLSASDAKREFGEVLLKAQKSPIGIKRNGKPVAVIISTEEYEQYERQKAEWLRQEIQQGLEDLDAGRLSDGEKVMKRLRRRLL